MANDGMENGVHTADVYIGGTYMVMYAPRCWMMLPIRLRRLLSRIHGHGPRRGQGRGLAISGSNRLIWLFHNQSEKSCRNFSPLLTFTLTQTATSGKANFVYRLNPKSKSMYRDRRQDVAQEMEGK